MDKSYFTDIPGPSKDNPLFPRGQSFSDLQDFKSGRGSKSMGMDQQGLWLGADKFIDAPFRVDMLGNATATSLSLTGGVIKFGKSSFTNSAAGYYISSEGIYFGANGDTTRLKYTIATGTLDLIGTISGRNTATVASAINSSGNLITNVINSNFDTASRYILGSFTFQPSGAIAMNTDANNGVWLSPTGILGKKAGVTTFAIDTLGNATFGGTLAAASGTFGTITSGSISGVSISGGTITGSTVQTASSGARIELSTNGVRVYESDATFNSGLRVRVASDINGSGDPGIGFWNDTGDDCGHLRALNSFESIFGSVGVYFSRSLYVARDVTLGASGTAYTTKISGKLKIPVGTNLY